MVPAHHRRVNRLG